MQTMLNWSGGIDSTYVMWKWCLDNPKEKLLVHHCSLRTYQHRWKKEDQAVNKILKWFEENGITNFEYVETIFDVEEAHPMLYDITLMWMAAGSVIMSRKYNTITKFLVNTPQDEFIRLGKKRPVVHAQAERVRKAIIQRDLESIHYVKGLYKKDIINAMPKDLLELCWFCRTPTKNGRPCGSCHTCKQVEGVLK